MFWLAYAFTCALLHHILAHHYSDACKPSWWPFLESTVYCELVRKTLHVLRASPLLAALPGLRGLPQLHQ